MKVNNSSDSSSSYTNAAYSSKGVSGLASGIDTESVVQAMLMTEQNKIDKQTQQQQILEWKQDAYRDVITKINDFQDKYFNLTSDSCIRLASLYNTMSAESSSKAVTVTPSSSAVDGNFTMQVAQLATSTSVSSTKKASNAITADTAKANAFEYSREVKFTIGDTELTADLKGVNDIQGIVEKINNDTNRQLASYSESVSVKDESGKALSYKLYDGDTEYTGNVRVSLTYTDEEGHTLTKDGDKFKLGDAEYTGTVKTSASFTKEDGITPLTVKYQKSDGSDLSDDEVSKINISQNITQELKLSAGGADFKVSGSSAGLAILGFSKAQDSSVITSKSVNTTYAQTGKVNGTVDFTLDGITKSFAIGEGEDAVNNMDDLAKKVKAAFGSAVQYNETTKSFSVEGMGRQLTVSANKDTLEAIGFGSENSSLSTQIRRTDKLTDLGITPSNVEEGDEVKSGTFTLNGVEIKYDENDTVSSLINKINNSDAGVKLTFNDLSATFKLESKNSGAGFKIELSDDENNVFDKLGFEIDDTTKTFKASTVKDGQNAIVNIDGTTIERSSNKMNYNGQLIDLNSTTGNYKKSGDQYEVDGNGNLVAEDGTVEQKAEITSSRNVDKIYDKLKAFVDDYNTLIEDLNKMTHEDANYKKYPPLTEAQKKEMSENEIKLWEEKSKQGLLRNDRDISSFLSDMRSAMYTKGDSKYILSSIGINSSSQWSDYGKLSIDEDTLKSALKNNANEVAKLFTGDNGLATRLNDICKKTANTSSGSRGSLVIRAGVKGKATEKDNEIYDQLQTIKDKLEKLNAKYESRKERLWKQFNAMEEAISKANSQSDYFANWM